MQTLRKFQINKKINANSLKKAKLLVTIVDRNKAEFYLDILEQFEINMQFITLGRGTASTEVSNMLGISNYKAIIFSIVREDIANKVLTTLDTKFKTTKKGKGVSVLIPLSSVMGVRLYQFMINNQERKA